MDKKCTFLVWVHELIGTKSCYPEKKKKISKPKQRLRTNFSSQLHHPAMDKSRSYFGFSEFDEIWNQSIHDQNLCKLKYLRTESFRHFSIYISQLSSYIPICFFLNAAAHLMMLNLQILQILLQLEWKLGFSPVLIQGFHLWCK